VGKRMPTMYWMTLCNTFTGTFGSKTSLFRSAEDYPNLLRIISTLSLSQVRSQQYPTHYACACHCKWSIILWYFCVQLPLGVVLAIPHNDYPINLLLQHLLLETPLCLNPHSIRQLFIEHIMHCDIHLHQCISY